MKIMFLDFDGVISTHRALIANRCKTFVHRDIDWIDPIAVKMIADLCAQFNYQIVVTSTWRKFGKQTCTEALGRANIWMHYDWCTKEIWPKGPNASAGSRPAEIEDWIARNGPVEDYLIIDDDGFNWLPEQVTRWIKTDGLNGFSTENYNEVLNRNEV
jgi:hypothetical protein